MVNDGNRKRREKKGNLVFLHSATEKWSRLHLKSCEIPLTVYNPSVSLSLHSIEIDSTTTT